MFSITGDPTGYKQLVNYVQCSGSAGDSFVISGWAWADSAVPELDYDAQIEAKLNGTEAGESRREFSITLTLHYHDGTTGKATAKFNPGSNSWQYTAAEQDRGRFA